MTETAEQLGHVGWQAATITAILPLTESVKAFRLKPTSPVFFTAGQHVDIRLTAPDGYTAQRSYSIADIMPDGEIELAIDLLPDGEVSPFFHDVAAVGDEIELRGPLGGHFVWRAEDGGPVLLIAGGSGVVPLVAMVRARARAGSDVPLLLLYAARRSDELLYRNELVAASIAQHPILLRFALSRGAAPPSHGYARRIDAAMIHDCLRDLAEPPRQVYCCGSNTFVNAATDAAIAAGIPAGLIRTERYGG